MAGGIGGLTAGGGHMQLASGQDLADMRDPQAIMGNLNRGNMIAAPQTQQNALMAQGMGFGQ